MSDIRTVWNNDLGYGDWALSGTQLAAGDDLTTAIFNRIFTDRQANADDVIPDGTTDRRGWWGDPTFGSRMWLLERGKQIDENLKKAADYCAEALQDLIDDGVVASFDIDCSYPRTGLLGIVIVAHKRDGTRLSTQFDWVWNGVT